MKKNDLFKLSLIFVIIAIILTWILPTSYFSSGELVADEYTRVGLFDISTYGFLGLYYFIANFIFVMVVAGFYKLLNNIEAYRVITDKIANFMKGKKALFVAAVILLFAVLSSIISDQLVLLVFAPFFISILSKMKVDKVSGVAATFGGILVGIIGATYSTNIVGILVSYLGVEYGYEILAQWILFSLSYVTLVLFVTLRMNKVVVTEENELKDPFETVAKDTNKKVNVLPLVIIGALVTILTILGFVAWSTSFNVDVFETFNTNLRSATLFGQPVFEYILGSSNYAPALGSWSLFNAVGVLILASLIIKIIYRIPFNKVIESFADGIKKIGNVILVMLTIYATLIISVSFPTILSLVGKLGSNIFSMYLSTIVTGLFNVDFQYIVSMIYTMFDGYSNANVTALALQSAYGVLEFIAPTSMILMIGLAFNDVKYKDWFKFVWKIVAALLVLSIVVVVLVSVL